MVDWMIVAKVMGIVAMTGVMSVLFCMSLVAITVVMLGLFDDERWLGLFDGSQRLRISFRERAR